MPTPTRLSGPALIAIRAVRARWRGAIIDTPAGELTARLPPPGVTVSVPRGGFTAVGEPQSFTLPSCSRGFAMATRSKGLAGDYWCRNLGVPTRSRTPTIPSSLLRYAANSYRWGATDSLLPLNLLR